MRKPRVHPSAPPPELYAALPLPHGAPPPPYQWQPPPPQQPAFNPNLAPPPSVTYIPPPSGGRVLSEEEAEVYEEIKERGVSRGFRLKKGKVYKKHNPQLYTKRGCTDVLCCFLFLVFTAGWAVVAGIGLMWGDPERLINPTDSLGRRCGAFRQNAYNYTNRPYLFYFDITKCISYATALGGCQTPQTCVSQCPTEYFSYLQLQTTGPGPDFNNQVMKNLFCTEDVDKSTITNFATLRDKVANRQCAAYTVKSAPVLGRCVPQAIMGAADTLNDLTKGNVSSLDILKERFGDDGGIIPKDQDVKNSEKYVGSVVGADSVFTKIAHDLSKTWWQVLTLIGAAGVLAFIWTVIMRILGGLMIWTSILVVILGLGAGSAFSWLKWNTLKKAGAIDDFSFQPIFSVYFEMPTTWLVVAIVVSAVLLILLLVLLFVRKRITIAVALIEESSKAVGHMMSTLLFPIFPFILHLLVIALWGSVAIWLASSGQEICRVANPDGTVNNQSALCDCTQSVKNPSCVYFSIEKKENQVFWLQLYNLFLFFWMSCFVTALGDISLAGAFASHYWAMDKSKDIPSFPVLRALGRALRYNIGSLAFGSLIIALIKIIRVILDYLDKKLATAQNVALKVIFSMLKCCFWCMEVFFKFLTKNAYIMIAIYGQNFFTSAKRSFLLLTRNFIRAAVVNQVAGILLFIGKAMITVGMGVVAFFYFSGQWVVEGIPHVDLYYYFVPIIIVLIGSYFMADLFFDVYEMAVDTTFICFLEDSEQNDGSAEKPFYMSKRLQEILGKTNDPAK